MGLRGTPVAEADVLPGTDEDSSLGRPAGPPGKGAPGGQAPGRGPPGSQALGSPAPGSQAPGRGPPSRRAPGSQAERGAGRLSLLHRCAILYLTAPLAVWLFSWLDPWVGVPSAALLGAALWRALSGSWRPGRPSRAAVAAASVALLAVFFSPISGLFLGLSDWHVWPDWDIHRSVLLDMARGDWPTMLHGHLGGDALLLRYYLGWHMVPAGAARLWGAAALNWAVPLWTWCGAALAAMLFAQGFSTARVGALAAGALFLFSGLDGADVLLSRGLEVVADRSLSSILEYQPHLETLHVTPQHFLPGALGALLLVQLRDRRRYLSVAGVVLAACLFWSSLLAIALVAMTCAVAVGRMRWAASWQNLAAAPLALLVVAYMTTGTMEFQRGWMWDAWTDSAYMWARLAVLYATEFALLAFLLWRIAPSMARDPLFLVGLAVLFAAPLYYYGSSFTNEPGLRLPVPALVLLAYWAVRAAAGRAPEVSARVAGGGRGLARRGARWCVIAALVAGAGPVLAHYAGLEVSVFAYERGARSLRTDIVAWDVRRMSAVLPLGPVAGAVLRDVGTARREEPLGDRVVRSAWDVYTEQANRLVYVKRDCEPEVETASWLFLETDPPEAQRQLGPPLSRRARARWVERPDEAGGTTLWLQLTRLDHYVEDRGGCLAVADLASDSVNSLRTGQIDRAGRLLWEARAELRR